MSFRCGRWLFAVSLACQAGTLRVCADPNNLPFSNQARDGFENKLAELVARDLDANIEYTWWAERRSFLKNSLNSGLCDVVLGVPSTTDAVLTTRPYYASTYVFVSRHDRNLNISSLADEKLSNLRIGIHVVGDDYAPPAHALARRGLSKNLVGFSLFGADGEVSPPAKIINAVSRGDIDIAIVWGPFAGYFGKASGTALSIAPVTPPMWMGVPFTYSISMAVRRDTPELKDSLDRVLARECAAIRQLLAAYAIPTVPEEEPKCDASSQPVSAFSR